MLFVYFVRSLRNFCSSKNSYILQVFPSIWDSLFVRSTCQAVSIINQSHVVDLNVRLEGERLPLCQRAIKQRRDHMQRGITRNDRAVEEKFSEFAPCGNYGRTTKEKAA